jgi:hypothetical protein
MDPHFLMARREIAMVYGEQRRFDEALAAVRAAIAEGGENHFSLCVLGHVLAAAGRAAEARGVIEQLRTRRECGYVPPLAIAVVHAALGDIDLAFAELRLAYEDRSSPLMWIRVDPWVDGLRADPRYVALLRDMGLVAPNAGAGALAISPVSVDSRTDNRH